MVQPLQQQQQLAWPGPSGPSKPGQGGMHIGSDCTSMGQSIRHDVQIRHEQQARMSPVSQPPMPPMDAAAAIDCAHSMASNVAKLAAAAWQQHERLAAAQKAGLPRQHELMAASQNWELLLQQTAAACQAACAGRSSLPPCAQDHSPVNGSLRQNAPALPSNADLIFGRPIPHLQGQGDGQCDTGGRGGKIGHDGSDTSALAQEADETAQAIANSSSLNGSLCDNLHDLEKYAPGCIFLVRRINRLGFESRPILYQHFSKYGYVERVLVPLSDVKSRSGAGRRLRPSGIGFIVMTREYEVQAILADGPNQIINHGDAQVCINVHSFEPCSQLADVIHSS